VNEERLRRLLRDVANGEVAVEKALESLRTLPFEDVGPALLDHHRQIRTGFPEVVYGEGKTPEDVVSVVEALAAAGAPVLVTRASEDIRHTVLTRFPAAEVDADARAIRLNRGRPRGGRIAVCCAGTSDRPVAAEAAFTAETFGAEVDRIEDVGVAGLHRLLAHLDRIRKADAVIVVAGMEGALPSVVAGLVAAPVIAVPTSVGYGASLNGMAALLAMLNSCAAGLVVVNIDNGFGAAVAAIRIARACGTVESERP
jgi:pyridinium-3,5-biscarboxylic acid mononucleotide synthase